MLSMFRKEMKKWHSVLWVVLASLVLSGVVGVVWRQPNANEMRVATVNGKAVTVKDFRRSFDELQERMRRLQEFSAMYGISLDMMLKSFFGDSDLGSLALENSIRDALLGSVESTLNVQISPDYFKEELVKGLPSGITDEQGRINMDYYQGYLQQLHLTASEFEEAREEELKRNVVSSIVNASFYAPAFEAAQKYAEEHARKSFKILCLPKQHFLHKIKEAGVVDEELQKFFDAHKEEYRIPEKRRAEFVIISPKRYHELVDIDEAAVNAFYEKNKSGSFRTPPQVKVRRIFIKKSTQGAQELAKKIHEELTADPDKFAQLAKAHSQDEMFAKDGGLTPLFKRGSYDADFEKIAFALRQPGELSAVETAPNGFEIVRLEERVSGSEKPLDEVRDEIVAALRSKKALTTIKSDLEMVMHKGKADPQAFDDFLQSRKLSLEKTDWLENAKKNPKSKGKEALQEKLAERLFGKGAKSAGYFVHEGDYVLFRADGVEEASYPSLQDVKKEVADEYFEKTAADNQRNAAKEIKKNVLEGKGSLDDAAGAFKLVTTEPLDMYGKAKDLPEGSQLIRKAFVLSAPELVLESQHNGDIYIIQLVNSEQGDEAGFASRKRELLDQQRLKTLHTQMNAFIASLRRNAKIETNDNVLNSYKSM